MCKKSYYQRGNTQKKKVGWVVEFKLNEPHFLHYALELKGCYFDRKGRLALDRKLHHNQIRGSVEILRKYSLLDRVSKSGRIYWLIHRTFSIKGFFEYSQLFSTYVLIVICM